MLDTSILLLGGAWHHDVISILRAEGYRLILPDCVLQELERIAQGRQERSRLAQGMLARITREDKLFKATCAARRVDEAVLQLAVAEGCLATADYPLAQRARKLQVRVFILTRKGLRVYGGERIM